MSVLLELAATPYIAAAAALAAYLFAGWLWSLARNDVSVVDILWGPGFLLVAAVAAVVGSGAAARRNLGLVLVALWAARLAVHIGRRNLGQGEDARYGAMRKRRGPAFRYSSLLSVFALQGGLLLFIAQPLIAIVVSPVPTRLGGFDLAGACVFVAGFLFEAVGDEQLRRFKADPAHRGRVMDRGLWRFTRHPNYFGDALLWWGFYLVACGVRGGAWTILGPLLMTFLLVKVSGVALLERGLARTRPGYADYIARTSAFVPWFPKRRGR